MLERIQPALRWVSAALAILALLQVAGIARRARPLGRTSIPEVPTWSPAAPPPGPVPAGPNPAIPPGSLRPGGPAGGPPGAPVSATTKARIEGIVQSEVLGMVMRPPPMALLGIVGEDALLRAPNGMSGLVRVGAELGGVQVLRIGTNRVLVKEAGEEKELTIFGGIGGDSLLTQPKQGTP